MTELRSAIHPNNENAHPTCSEGGGEPRPCTSKKCAGPKLAPTGEQGTGTLCPREQTSENACDAVLSECVRMRP